MKDISTYVFSRIGPDLNVDGIKWPVFNGLPSTEYERYIWWTVNVDDDIDEGVKERPIYPFEIEITIVERVGVFYNTDLINKAVSEVKRILAPRGSNLIEGNHKIISTRLISYNENTEATGLSDSDKNKFLVRKLVIRILAEELNT